MKEKCRRFSVSAVLPRMAPGFSFLSSAGAGKFHVLKPMVYLSVVFIGCFLLLPENAWALQSHGAPEGLYVHQMAHIHFILALGYLYWDIQRSSFPGKGWRYLRAFCVLMLCWNIVAFVGHAVAGSIDAKTITTVGGYLQTRIQGPVDLQKFTFYFAKFDHILAVPALFFLYVGMRSLYRSVEKHAGEVGK